MPHIEWGAAQAEYNWHKMKDKVIIQKPKGTIDAAGGTPEDYEDYIIGSDGTGVYAESRTPSMDEQVIAMAKEIRISHSFKVRYDSRILEDMRLKWWDDGSYHYAKINTVTPEGNNEEYMGITATEQRHQAGAF